MTTGQPNEPNRKAGDAAVPCRPNIVFILADDLGYGDVGCYGAEGVWTPHIDRVAAEGIRCTDVHSPSSVCTPSRYNLLTGRYCWRTWAKTGCIWWHDPILIDEGQTTLASMLQEQGYTTGLVGKWHLGFGRPDDPGFDPVLGLDPNGEIAPGPCEVGFDSFFGVPAIAQKPHFYIRDRHVVGLSPEDPIHVVADPTPEWTVPFDQRPRSHNPNLETVGGQDALYDHDQVTVDLTEEAVRYIETHAGDIQPFFLYFAVRNVHAPLIPAPEFRGTSECGAYGDFVHELDWSVGQVLQALDRAGIADDTLVVVTSDNGATQAHQPVAFVNNQGLRSNGPFRGQKSEVYEGGHRVPFIARWPGVIPANTSTDQTIALTDMLATFAALTGRPLGDEEGPDSFNVLPALLGTAGSAPLRPGLVHDSMMHQMFAVRAGRWKLIIGRGGGGIGAGWTGKPSIERFGSDEPPGQLYDLEADPSEQNNLYARCPDEVQLLTALLQGYRHDGRSR